MDTTITSTSTMAASRSWLSKRLRNFILPVRVGIPEQVLVVEMRIACHLRAQKVGFLERLIDALQFYFGKYQPIIVTVELINLEGVSGEGNEIACLLNHSSTAQLEHRLCIGNGYLALKLIARDAVGRRTFDGEECLFAVKPHAHRRTLDIHVALTNEGTRYGGGDKLREKNVAANKELTFYLLHETLNIEKWLMIP